MSYSRSLHRKIDDDLVNQIEAKGKATKTKPHRPNKGKPPRAGESYRPHRREWQKHFRREQKRLRHGPL